MFYRPVADIADIDLSRHALIEASAGTGKTYTLENLVVRLLKERQDIAIENILMVTFTEKATSELKTRIQEKLLQEIRSAGDRGVDGTIVQKIRDTLDAFDSASIYTIHGFCHTVLKDFAFENGSLFQNEVVDDAPIFDTLIKEQMRKDWPEVYGGNLPEMLQVAGFSSRKNHFLSLVVNIARRVFRPAVGDEPNRGEGLIEVGIVGHDCEVTVHREGAPDARRGAVDGADPWLRGARDGHEYRAIVVL